MDLKKFWNAGLVGSSVDGGEGLDIIKAERVDDGELKFEGQSVPRSHWGGLMKTG